MIRLVTPSDASAVLPLATLKSHLRIDHADEDALLGIYAAAAVRTLEARTGRSLGPATWKLTLANVPAVIDIGVPNVTAITSLKIVDRDGVEQTVPSGDILLTAGEYGAIVEPEAGATWPEAGTAPNACEITFTAGYAAVPSDIMAALLLTAATFHRNRAEGDMPQAVRSLVAPYVTGGWL